MKCPLRNNNKHVLNMCYLGSTKYIFSYSNLRFLINDPIKELKNTREEKEMNLIARDDS